MKILIPTKHTVHITGPERWKQNLFAQLSQDQNLKVIYGYGLLSLKQLFWSDVIHIYYVSILNVKILLLSKILNKKTVFTVHGDYFSESDQKHGLKKLLWLPLHILCTKLADKITFPSRYLYNKILLHQPELKNKSHIIYNGIGPLKTNQSLKRSDIGLKESGLLLVTITNFDLEQKARGFKLLSKEFEKFLKDHPQAYLLVVGGGKLQKRYADQNDNDRIRFLGYRKDAVEILKLCDLFVYFSLLDNLPYVILEALTLNKPVQSLPTGGIPEVLPAEYITKGEINLLRHKRYNLPVDISAQRMAHEFSKLYKN